MKIGKKLIMMIVILNIVGTAVLTGTILTLAQKHIRSLIDHEITNLAREHAMSIKAWLELYMDATRTVGQIMTTYEALEPAARRPFFNLILRSLAEENPEIIASGSCWEPNALDGLDAEFVNTPGTDHTGRFIPYWVRNGSTIHLKAQLGYDKPGEGSFYLIPKQTGKETIIEPYTYMINGKEVLMTTLVMPINQGGRFVGMANIDIDVGIIQKRVEKIKPYEGAVAMVYSHGGLVSGHFDSQRIGKLMANTEQDVAGPYLNDLMKAIQGGAQFTFTNHVSNLNETMFFVCVPFIIGNSSTPWSLMLGIPQGAITAPIYRMLLIGTIIAVLMLLLMSVGAFVMSQSISKPLNQMVLVLDDIGEGDLTKRLEAKSKDEIGDMTQSFNHTLNKIGNLIRIIRQKAQSLSQTGSDLSLNMNTTAAAINEITAHIQGLKKQVTHQSDKVTDTSHAMEKISTHIVGLNGQIEQQAESVSQSSSAIEEMLANIQSVTNTLVKNADNVQALAEASGVGRAGLEEVAGDIQGIARDSEGLLEINEVMENIASQTNLLSMNAAIEAAHAGEAGKGFAVVADEIRKLAESSGEQSKTISGVLKKIKESIDKITRSTNQVLNKFEAIDRGIKTVAEQEENIRSAMEEQGVGSKQILDAVSHLNDITSDVKQSSNVMNTSSKEVIATSQTLESISREISYGMQEIASGADQINTVVNQVNEISGQNKKDIDELIQEVNKFHVD
ncbi:MAG: methyl-accepting chemotaxis protein [Treponema sp.]|jgi:methyl-accepting chemotaxis protein|nr:methyl-accepting chemotaxis protein [Treponema sp.]